MAERFYIMKDGQRVYFTTLDAVRRAAQRLANQLGRKVAVGYETGAITKLAGYKGGRYGKIDQEGVYSRNPIIDEYAAHQFRMHGARQSVANAKASEIAKHTVRATPKAKRSPSKDGANARKAGATRSDNPYDPGSMGHRLWLNGFERNPRKSKLTGSRGYYVEWHYAGTGSKQRIKYGNKGIATIRANELKRDGAKGVRIYSA